LYLLSLYIFLAGGCKVNYRFGVWNEICLVIWRRFAIMLAWHIVTKGNNILDNRKKFVRLTSCYVKFLHWPSLWSNCQNSWLQIQKSGFDSRRYKFFWEVVGLERSLLSLVTTTVELLGRKSIGSGLENRDTAVGISHADHMGPTIHKIWH
jgi:hypothetical protein